jgi:serine/threonine protein kinase
MGSVLKVERLCDGRLFALKWCRGTGASVRRFAREVRLMARVRHRHVVPVVDANLDADPPYFVMPLASSSLEDELPQLVGHESESLAVFRQACLGVQALHGSGIVHRDIKPANILRFQHGRIAVADLGVSKLTARDTTVLTRTRAVVGTLAFLAPEQLLPEGSREADVRTDIFQLGKVLYRLLTGHSPAFIDANALPRGLSHILLRATSANPDDRYRDLGELLDALRYYELAKDPANNAREALENLVLQAEDLLGRAEPPGELLREILALLTPLERLEPGTAIARVDRLPDALLPILAGEYPAEFLPVLRGFVAALPARVGGFKFDYADQLARRMRGVFCAAKHPALKTLALEATLVGSVALNRFAAMDAFNRLLMSVATVEYALPIAEMLRARASAYSEVAHGAPPDRLHPAIRDVQSELMSTADISF